MKNIIKTLTLCICVLTGSLTLTPIRIFAEEEQTGFEDVNSTVIFKNVSEEVMQGIMKATDFSTRPEYLNLTKIDETTFQLDNYKTSDPRNNKVRYYKEWSFKPGVILDKFLYEGNTATAVYKDFGVFNEEKEDFIIMKCILGGVTENEIDLLNECRFKLFKDNFESGYIDKKYSYEEIDTETKIEFVNGYCVLSWTSPKSGRFRLDCIQGIPELKLQPLTYNVYEYYNLEKNTNIPLYDREFASNSDLESQLTININRIGPNVGKVVVYTESDMEGCGRVGIAEYKSKVSFCDEKYEVDAYGRSTKRNLEYYYQWGPSSGYIREYPCILINAGTKLAETTREKVAVLANTMYNPYKDNSTSFPKLKPENIKLRFEVEDLPEGYTADPVYLEIEPLGDRKDEYSVNIEVKGPEVQKGDLIVVQNWNDNNNKYNSRTQTRKYNVLRNGEVLQEIELTNETEWKTELKELEIEDSNGKPYEFSLEPLDKLEGYTDELSVKGNVLIVTSTYKPPVVNEVEKPSDTKKEEKVEKPVVGKETGVDPNLLPMVLALVSLPVCGMMLFSLRKQKNVEE